MLGVVAPAHFAAISMKDAGVSVVHGGGGGPAPPGFALRVSFGETL